MKKEGLDGSGLQEAPREPAASSSSPKLASQEILVIPEWKAGTPGSGVLEWKDHL